MFYCLCFDVLNVSCEIYSNLLLFIGIITSIKSALHKEETGQHVCIVKTVVVFPLNGPTYRGLGAGGLWSRRAWPDVIELLKVNNRSITMQVHSL